MGGLDINKIGLAGGRVSPMKPKASTQTPRGMDPPPPAPPHDNMPADGGGGGGDRVVQFYPRIQINVRQLRETIADSRRAVHLANQPPRIFTRSRKVVRVVAKGEDPPEIEMLGVDSMHGHLARIANWFSVTSEGEERECYPHKDVARDLLVNPDEDLPELETVAATPIFDRRGSLLTTPGYHASAHVWIHKDPTLSIEAVKDEPTTADVDAARSLILDELLPDFPFVMEADRTHAVAALFLHFVRRMVRGFTPLHLIEAPGPGSGKGLFADVVGIVAMGVNAEPTTVPQDEDETRKKLVSILLKGAPVILLDNLRTGIDSATIASALTADPWTDRRLGTNEMISLPNKSIWLATGNNPKLSTEIARRTIRIRIDPKRAQPWKRKKESFRHPVLREWVRQTRGRIVHALLTIVRSWIVAGAPHGEETLGSFESWASVLGGLLKHGGFGGFLANANELYEVADDEGGEWLAFATAWWRKYRSKRVRPSELAQLAREENLLGSTITEDKERAQVTKMGNILRGRKDLVIGPWKIASDIDGHTKAAVYALQHLQGEEIPGITDVAGPGGDVFGRGKQSGLDFGPDREDEAE